MNTTKMTFAAPSLQLKSNTFCHSDEFKYRKPDFKQNDVRDHSLRQEL